MRRFITKFGQLPRGERLERIKRSPNYKDGQFRNLTETSVFTSGKNQLATMLDLLMAKRVRVKPEGELPTIKTDLKALDAEQDVLVWFGHSSYFLRLSGKTFLIDPVFSAYASPVFFLNRSYNGTNIISADDVPPIDYLLITHDHWDHLDYATITGLKSKVSRVICSLGIGQHFEFWGYKDIPITELDWYEDFDLGEDSKITATPARHFSGRGVRSNRTLWASFVLKIGSYNLYLGGDGGYDFFLEDIGTKFGPFDLAILEQGQYNVYWNQIHLLPEQLMDAALRLQARCVLPVHNSKFAMASHPWDEPLNQIVENVAGTIPIVTPKIGEPVFLSEPGYVSEMWWK
jgi:L-ascorbate metabolism protein UlaG (beta-lactamase superfamily)